MDELRKFLELPYRPEEVSAVMDGIQDLWDKYGQIETSDFKLTEKDVALITYGDQVSGGQTPKLQTLRAFLKKYLAETISMVHILPFYPYTSDDGFSVVDYYQVRKDLGDWEDLNELAQDFHLMYDGVINHMSSSSEWFQEYLKNNPLYKDYFIDGSTFHNLQDVVRPRTSPLVHDFAGKWVWTTFSKDQVDINYQNPKVLLQILDVLLHYVSNGASLLRLDAIGFMWKKDGTSCIHLDETHAIIKIIRLVIEEVAPHVLLITETNVPHEENISYFGAGDEAHMVYNFTLPPLLAHSILNHETSKIKAWAKTLKLTHRGTCFFNFLSSHDGVGLRPVDGILADDEIDTLIKSAEQSGGRVSHRSVNGVDKPYEINCNYFSLLRGQDKTEPVIDKMVLAHAVLLTFPGLPAIYFHSLFGMQNDLEGLEKLGYNRAINREKFELERINGILEDESSPSFQVLSRLENLIRVRKGFEQFDPYADFEILDTEDGVLGISRFKNSNNPVLAYFNLMSRPRQIRLEGSWRNILTNEKVSDELKLEPYQFAWLVNVSSM